jgi:hypothetical protein
VNGGGDLGREETESRSLVGVCHNSPAKAHGLNQNKKKGTDGEYYEIELAGLSD